MQCWSKYRVPCEARTEEGLLQIPLSIHKDTQVTKILSPIHFSKSLRGEAQDSDVCILSLSNSVSGSLNRPAQKLADKQHANPL